MKKLITLITLALLALAPRVSVAADPSADFDKSMDAYLSNDANVEKIANAIQRFFQKKQVEAQQEQMKAEEQQMEEQFKNPAKIDIGSSPVRGNPSAKVTIITFSDFQCPFCKRGAQIMEELLKQYPNDVKYVFKNMPLPMHPEAEPAARAALAAGEQGKFWEMHDKLFGNQESLGADTYVKFAQELGLNVDKFKADMTGDKVSNAIKADMAAGEKNGIQGTPGFFVNGVKVSGARPVPFFKKLIDRWLAQK